MISGGSNDFLLVHAGSKSQKSFRRLAGQDLEIALRFVPQKKTLIQGRMDFSPNSIRNANLIPWAVSIKIAVRIFVSRSSWYRPSCEIENLVVGRCTHDPGWYPLVCSMSEHTRKPCIAGHPLHFERNLPRETIFKKCENFVSKKS